MCKAKVIHQDIHNLLEFLFSLTSVVIIRSHANLQHKCAAADIAFCGRGDMCCTLLRVT